MNESQGPSTFQSRILLDYVQCMIGEFSAPPIIVGPVSKDTCFLLSKKKESDKKEE